jgi:hypothetical protein
MFFRRKTPTLQDHEERLTALELLFDARAFDQAQSKREPGPRSINDIINATLASYAKSAGLRMPRG